MEFLKFIFVICWLKCCFCSSPIFYIYWPAPHPNQCTGGIAALHYLHHAILSLGYDSKYHSVSTCYDGLYQNNNLEVFDPSVLRREDIVIVPEVFATQHLQHTYLQHYLPSWQAQGCRVVVWALAGVQTLPPTYNQLVPVHLRELTKGGVLVAANSDYIRRRHGLYTHHVLKSPLTPEYKLPKRSGVEGLLNADGNVGDDLHALLLEEEEDSGHLVMGMPPVKHDLVLLDNDHLNVLDVHAIPWHINGYRVIQLGGMNRTLLTQLYRRAKVVVDLYVPGAERIVQECGLYDVVPVLSHHLNGATVQDFPISSLKELLVDPTDAQDILRGIRAAVERYDDILSSDIWSHFQTNILVHDPTADWRNLASGSLPHPTTHNLAAIDSWSSSASIVLSIFSHTEQQDQWLFATILSAFFYNPLLRLKVYVRHVDLFLTLYMSMIDLLVDQGLTDHTGGQPFHSLVFYPLTSTPSTTNVPSGSTNVVHVFIGRSSRDGGSSTGVLVPSLRPVLDTLRGCVDRCSASFIGVQTVVSSGDASGTTDMRSMDGLGQVVPKLKAYYAHVGDDDNTMTEERAENAKVLHGFTSLHNDYVRYIEHPGCSSSFSYPLYKSSRVFSKFLDTITSQDNSQYDNGSSSNDVAMPLILASELRHDSDLFSHFERTVMAGYQRCPGNSGSTHKGLNESSSGEGENDPLSRSTSHSNGHVEMSDVVELFGAEGVSVIHTHTMRHSTVLTGAASKEHMGFSYAFPLADQDSRKGVLPYKVLEPGLTRVWYNILSGRISGGGVDLCAPTRVSDDAANPNPNPALVEQEVIIDVGGNFGYYSLLGASCGYNVISFEPVPHFQKMFQLNMQLNPLLASRVMMISSALGDNHEPIQIIVPTNGTLGTARKADYILEEDVSSYKVTVPSTTLDDYWYDSKLDTVNRRLKLLKIDVEGHEAFVIFGGQRLIKEQMPAIVLEYQPKHIAQTAEGQTLLLWVLTFLRDELNYRIFYIPWEEINYPPSYEQDTTVPLHVPNASTSGATRGSEKDGTSSTTENRETKEFPYVDATSLSIEEFILLQFTVNFWMVPPNTST